MYIASRTDRRKPVTTGNQARDFEQRREADEHLDRERREFIRSAVIVFAYQAKLATEDELVADAQKLWAALQKADC